MRLHELLEGFDIIDARNAGYKPHSPETWRAWEYWATRAGCAHLLARRSSSDA